MLNAVRSQDSRSFQETVNTVTRASKIGKQKVKDKMQNALLVKIVCS